MESLEKYFDVAFAAPEGIKKLRELILTLAMQGKLVPQDPNDQPVSELLRKIDAEKRQLVKAGKIRQPKPLPEIKSEEVPYELPESWSWVRLNDFGTWKSGSTPSRTNSSYFGGDIPWVKSGEVKQGRIWKTEEMITKSALENCSLDINPIGSVLIAMYGANIGETGVLEIEATTNQAVCACKTFCGVDNKFLARLISSLKQDFISQGAGAAQPNISREKIINTLAPLPPFAEQKRIVTRIDQLMTRCDELEKLRTEREQKRLTVHISALNSLLEAQEPDSFAAVWHFINRHFAELYSVKENVTELRKAILQLAVMGKLVPQDSNDQPASELLKEIEVEKLRLVKEGKIKQQKPVPEVNPADVLYALPLGWEWVRFGNISINRDGERIPVSKDDRNKVQGEYDYYGASGIIDKVNDFIFDKDLLLIGEDGANLINRSTPIAFIASGKYWVNNHAHVIDAHDFQLLLYLEKYFNAIDLKPYVTGTAQPKMNQAKMNSILVALPPLAEQHRIVAKIDQLMALSDKLEQQIDATTCKQSTLLNAVMAHT